MRPLQPGSEAAPKAPQTQLRRRIVGAGCGLVCAALASHLGLGVVVFLAPLQSLPLMAFLGALLGAGRGHWVVPSGVVALLALALLVDCTPWAGRAISGLIVRDKLGASEAVVVLAADILPDGTPSLQSQQRLEHAFQLLSAHWSRRLVLTRFGFPRPSYAPWVRAQLKRARLGAEVLEAGRIRITSDEARAVAALARARGWRRVILVTDRSHTRRASALFREAGLGVLCSPCADPGYGPSSLNTPEERRAAFRDWLYETVWFHAHFSLRLV